MTLEPGLLAILACPVCKGSLDLKGDSEGLSCQQCAVVYPIREEIPIMLAEEAVPLREWENGGREAGFSMPNR